MNFKNKGLSNFLRIIFYAAIVLIVIRISIYLLPFILLVTLIGWVGVKGVRAIKRWKSKRKNGGNIVNNVDIIEDDNPDDLSNKKVIDVDYTEVK